MYAINPETLIHRADERINDRAVVKRQLSCYTGSPPRVSHHVSEYVLQTDSPSQETVSKQFKPVSQLPL